MNGFIDEELEEDPYFTTPLDDLDPYIIFAQVISQLPSQHSLIQSIRPEQQAPLKAIMDQAEQNRSKVVKT